MKEMSIALFAFLVVSVFTSGFRTTLGSTVGITWIKYPGNPLNLGSCVSWPWVVYDGQKFKMWYTNLTEAGDVENICFADSPDGIDWTRHGVVLDRGELGSWDSACLMAAVVLYDETTYKMWYLGMGPTWGSLSVGYATSLDGMNWTKFGKNPVLVPGGNGGWDNWNICPMSIIFNGTHYIMWYGAQAVPDCNVAMGVATSVDGVNWTKYPANPVLVGGPSGWDSAHIFAGPVIAGGSQYEMWYYGQPRDLPGGIGLATSPDGFSWTKYGGNPVLESGPTGAWDCATVHGPSVVEKDGHLLMWYSGLDWAGSQRIGLATSRARLVNFFLHDGASLDTSSPTAVIAKYKDSPSIKFSGGNPWKEIGVWTAPALLTDGRLEELSGLDVWLGLKNSDDQGTNFDLRAEVYKDGVLVASGETYLIKGVTRNPDKALKVTVSFGSFSPVDFDGIGDTLSLKILTRIGTDGNGKFGGGHSGAVGLRLYFDAVSRPAVLAVSIS